MSKVLLVDDDSDVLLYISTILTREGNYSIETAEDGEEALKKVASDPPDIIILDLMMPGINGMEVCRSLKSDEVTKYIPVIMLSARRDITDIVEGMETGANDYLTKPFNPEELVARLQVHLRIRALEEELASKRELEGIMKMSITRQHEINNPVTGVIGNAELLRDWKNLSAEEIDEFLVSILDSAARIKNIIGQMKKITHVVSTSYIGGREMIDIEKSSQD